MYDIIIIGGNLSGSSAAINAAKKGVKCALIEQHKEPFLPAHCGEGIADVMGDFLELDNIKCPKNQIDLISISLSNLKKYKFRLTKHKMLIINRNYLEKNLLKKAEQNGVALFIGNGMKDFKPPNNIILNNNEKLKGKIIIDATGISCLVGSKIGTKTKLKPEDVGVCIQSRVKSFFNKNIVHLWYHKPYAPFGYAWVFPIDDNTANIGLGIPGGQKIDLQKLLTEYINYETDNSFEILNTFRSCVPNASPLNELVKDNVMFVGDAARLANPATGAGIHNAIISGSLAGCIAAKYIKSELESLEIYQNEMKRILSRLAKTYKNKTKLTTDKKFLYGYKKAFSMLNVANSLLPGFFQNYVAKNLLKNLAIIEKYKEMN